MAKIFPATVPATWTQHFESKAAPLPCWEAKSRISVKCQAIRLGFCKSPGDQKYREALMSSDSTQEFKRPHQKLSRLLEMFIIAFVFFSPMCLQPSFVSTQIFYILSCPFIVGDARFFSVSMYFYQLNLGINSDYLCCSLRLCLDDLDELKQYFGAHILLDRTIPFFLIFGKI